MSNFGYYIFLLAFIIIGCYVIKKVTSCMIKTVVFFVLILVMACVYYFFVT